MSPLLTELKPNRLLLDSNFDGYKLSSEEVPKRKKELTIPVDRVLLNTQQYSLLHANLYCLHNHLIGDPYNESNSTYFIDREFNICKLYIDPFNDELIEPICVLNLPRSRERKTGDYNVSLKFVSSTIAVIGDGIGTLFIVETGTRIDDANFTICFNDEVAGQNEPFVIVDAILKVNEDNNPELHVLALSLKQETKNERFFTVLHWITFSKVKDTWGQVALKQIKTKGSVQYSYLEKKCQAVYVVSDARCKIILNSDVPVQEKSTNNKKSYKWSQNIKDISIKIHVSANTSKEQINVKTEITKIEIKCGNNILVVGELYKNIDPNMTTWTFKKNMVEVTLSKCEKGYVWPELIKNDASGEYILETCIADETNNILAHFTAEKEVSKFNKIYTYRLF